jgi:hypothetical protein
LNDNTDDTDYTDADEPNYMPAHDNGGDPCMDEAKPARNASEECNGEVTSDGTDFWHRLTLHNEGPHEGKVVDVLESELLHAMQLLQDLKTEQAQKTNVLELTPEDQAWLNGLKVRV